MRRKNQNKLETRDGNVSCDEACQSHIPESCVSSDASSVVYVYGITSLIGLQLLCAGDSLLLVGSDASLINDTLELPTFAAV